MSSLLVIPVPATYAVVAVPVQNPAPPPGEGEEFGKASPVALVVIIVLALATVVLIRSMTKRIRRLPASFEREQAPGKNGGDTRAGRRRSAGEARRERGTSDRAPGEQGGVT